MIFSKLLRKDFGHVNEFAIRHRGDDSLYVRRKRLLLCDDVLELLEKQGRVDVVDNLTRKALSGKRESEFRGDRVFGSLGVLATLCDMRVVFCCERKPVWAGVQQ